MLLSMVLITVEGDITEDSGDPVDPQKIAFSRAERGGKKNLFSASAENTGSHSQTDRDKHTHI